VSRKHIQIFRRGKEWWLKNLSDNGTWLNGKPVPQNEERAIGFGDELKLSSKCRLLVWR
jgi:pSer/pThr/pTyr-binding forkhead associated (FHA) protein